ncbi:MAG: metal-dependent hydrolase [Chloroflexota bacterium]|nr:metal-dependent hydrolase [Chloroflexota bacterium]
MEKLNNGVELTWLGHATWLVRSPEGKRILFDPFLENNPACPEEYKGEGIDELDVIICTHGHSDHVGDLVTVAQRTGATVVGIFDLITWAESKGVTNTMGGNKGGTLEIDGIKVTLVNALHSSSMMDGEESVDMGDPCGFILEFENGYRLYNTGDTDVFGDMALIAELYEPDLVMMPIGDHFTMGPRQAAKAIQLMKAQRVVPHHFGTFPVLTGTPEQLKSLVGEEVEVLAVQPGETIR